MATFSVRYFEINCVHRIVEASTFEEAIAISEARRADGDWDDCEEQTGGTNGVELVVDLDTDEIVFDAGTRAGFAEEAK